MNFKMTVNSKSFEVKAYPMERLLDVIRENLHFTGPKEGCGEGECGACSIFLDGVLVNSCLVPVIQANHKRIETIEFFGDTKNNLGINAVQRGFLECGGAQCGICTPGMVHAAIDLLRKHPKPTIEEIKNHLGGNLCRCTGYTRIFDSVLKASELLEKGEASL